MATINGPNKTKRNFNKERRVRRMALKSNRSKAVRSSTKVHDLEVPLPQHVVKALKYNPNTPTHVSKKRLKKMLRKQQVVARFHGEPLAIKDTEMDVEQDLDQPEEEEKQALIRNLGGTTLGAPSTL